MPAQPPARPEYFIEYYNVGSSVKVTAIDPVTMTEVSIVGSAQTHRDMLAKVAVQKLEYVLRKKSGDGTLPPPDDNSDTIA